MPKLSIVVIIYKVEEYLRKCIDSILSQTYANFELILVDDGSPDRCPQICDEYVSTDSRINVIHQNNQGSVIARWNGILASKGEYVSLIDGDDWLDQDMYEKMMALVEDNDADIVVTGYKEGTEENYICKKNCIESGLYSGDKIRRLYEKVLYTGRFYEPGIIPALWNKVIKRELFFKDYTPVSSMIKMGDDAAVSYPMLARARSVVIENEFCPYNYRFVENSMSRKYDPQYLNRCLELFRGLVINLRDNPVMSNQIKFYCLFIIEIGISQICSKSINLSIVQQRKAIAHFYGEYRKLNIDIVYDWDAIEDSSKVWMKKFMQGEITGMLFELYKNKLINKVRSRYAECKA